MRHIRIYCDESCHLENDSQPVMVLGALWSPKERTRAIAKQIKAIKKRHGLAANFEIKWTKVSPAKLDFYIDLLDYFFEEDYLNLRALIVPDKTKLSHDLFDCDHDTWYYKMYFEMLKVLFHPLYHYEIYLDIKDTKSGQKVAKLHQILCHNAHDFERQIVKRVQMARSDEIEQLQLVDLLIGCILGANRPLAESPAKRGLIERMRHMSELSLRETTSIHQRKINLISWQPYEVSHG